MIEKSELGIVKVSKEAIAGISVHAAREVKGVVGIGGGPWHRLCKFLKLSSSPGARVEILSNGDVIVFVPVIVEYGKEISGVASEVQEKVKKTLEDLTGLEVVKVDVSIDGVR